MMDNSSFAGTEESIHHGATMLSYFTMLRGRWLFPALLLYPILSNLLRFQRLKSLKKRFNYPTRESFSRMTDDDAWAIWNIIAELEFPSMFEKGLQFALFRTYGIPTISRLLVKTSQFSAPGTAVKRYTDTGALLIEIFAFPPSHPRVIEGFGRLNYLHGVYLQSGQIINDDMLYTLALFAIEPIKWIERYDWRKLSDLEKCALGTYIKSMGDAMLISYDNLPGSKAGFVDGLKWLEEIWAWMEDYEKRVMVPHEDNHTTAIQTTKVLTWTLPDALKPAGIHAVAALMDERLRKAMMYPAPPPIYPRILNAIFTVRRLFLRYLALPRPEFMRYRGISEEANENGRHFFKNYDALPYYVKPTFFNRWMAPQAWINKMLGLPVPGDNGSEYLPNGYFVPDVGPKSFVGKGAKQAKETKARLQKERTGGCPFAANLS